MKTLISILQLFPAILAAIRAAEEAIPASGQGKTKLDLVLGVVQGVYDASSELQSSFSWQSLVVVITKVINNVVAVLNAAGIFKKSAPAAAAATS